MNASETIVVVEDDAEIRTLVVDYLSKNGFTAVACDGAASLDRQLSSGGGDLIVLDLMMPGEDGLSICRRLRASGDIPILMLTARSDEVDRIVGLELGADDYLSKPFNPRELLARIRAILRRKSSGSGPQTNGSRILTVEHLSVNLDGRTVREIDGDEIVLTSAEFDLFECFLTRPGRVLSRDQLMDWTRGRQADVFDRTIDVQVSRLRKKIETSEQALIKTIRGQGYILTAAVRGG